jgi:hypothetical protein
MREDYLAFLKLQERSQDNFVGFLSTDLGFGETMLKLAQATQNPERRERLFANVRAVLNAVVRFEARITDGKLRTEIHNRADRLKESLSNEIQT